MIKLLAIGKTESNYIQIGIDEYRKRLKHYCKFELVEIPVPKEYNKLGFQERKKAEAELLLKQLSSNDYLILLDEKGKEFDSVSFANRIQKWLNVSSSLVFVIGGAFGFDQSVYDRAQEQLSLSPMTFTHQMVRLFAVEQIYRAFTILRGEKYHH